LADSSARVSASAFAKLWLAVARELDDEFLGLDSHGMPSSIGQALEQCLKGLGLFLRDIRGSLSIRDK
jgi:hypothetical protein